MVCVAVVKTVVATKKNDFFTINKTKNKELDELVNCSFLAFHNNQSELYLANYNDDEWYQKQLNQQNLYSIYRKKQLVGGIVLRRNLQSLVIDRLFIHPNFQNKDYEMKVIKQVEKMFADVNSFEVYAPLWNHRTNHLYQQLNYRTIKIEDDVAYFRKDIYSKRFFKGNQFIVLPEDTILKELVNLINSSNRQVLVKWSFLLIDELLQEEKFDAGVFECVSSAKQWAQGDIKMKETKKLILLSHQQAKKQNNLLIAAIAQGCSVVHTQKHALGFVLYELSWIYKNKSYPEVLDKIEHYKQTLQQIKENHIDNHGKWASFLRV